MKVHMIFIPCHIVALLLNGSGTLLDEREVRSMKGQDEVHSRAKRQATKMGEVKTELISVADTDSVGWGIWFRCRCRFWGFETYFPIQLQKRFCERTQRKENTKHVTQRDENGRGWPGPAVACMAPQCGISATILMEAGPGPSPGVNSLCFCFFVCVCVSLSACAPFVVLWNVLFPTSVNGLGASMYCCWARLDSLQRAQRPGQHKAS